MGNTRLMAISSGGQGGVATDADGCGVYGLGRGMDGQGFENSCGNGNYQGAPQMDRTQSMGNARLSTPGNQGFPTQYGLKTLYGQNNINRTIMKETHKNYGKERDWKGRGYKLELMRLYQV